MQWLLLLSGLAILGLSGVGYYVIFDLYVSVLPSWQVLGCLVVFAFTTTAGLASVLDSMDCTHKASHCHCCHKKKPAMD